MRLAADPITIEIAGEVFELHPSLRAATRLARRYGDFATIYRGIIEDHVTIVSDVIREGSGSGQAAADFLIASEIPGLRLTLEPLKLPLLRFTLALIGYDDDEQPGATKATGKPVPFAEYHAELFRIGTGWLGWSAADTWEATPAEILAAQHGRTDMIACVLKAIFGTTKDETPTPAPAPLVLNAAGRDPEFDRASLRKLKSVAA